MSNSDKRSLERMDCVVERAASLLASAIPSITTTDDLQEIDIAEALISQTNALLSAWSFVKSTCEEVLQ